MNRRRRSGRAKRQTEALGWLKPEMWVWYESRPGLREAGVVDTEPFEVESGDVVVHLRSVGITNRRVRAAWVGALTPMPDEEPSAP